MIERIRQMYRSMATVSPPPQDEMASFHVKAAMRRDDYNRHWVSEGGTICASCGEYLTGAGMCRWHPDNYGRTWALTNRIICDFIHRGKEPRRVAPSDRVDFWQEP